MKNKLLPYFLLLSSIVFFILGLTYPILAKKYQVFGQTLTYETVTLIDSIRLFYKDGDYLLTGIIALFTIAFPIIKYLDLGIQIQTQKKSPLLSKLDKWSMLDVFLVALLVLIFKMNGGILVVNYKIGIYFLVTSIVLRMLTAGMIKIKKS